MPPLVLLAFPYADGIPGFNSQQGLFAVAIAGASTAPSFTLPSRLLPPPFPPFLYPARCGCPIAHPAALLIAPPFFRAMAFPSPQVAALFQPPPAGLPFLPAAFPFGLAALPRRESS
ncbi:common pilus major fimbrillin subunit EcpA, partial [Escherichia coli]|uniref:common pilus major fimbrillin subunit EcpA n=1 Tax=Escherichia coli TaxID=562 RepID=UPI0035B1698B